MPDLSIIIVAFNGPDLLRATIASVIEHTHAVGYELIVVDSASTDPRVRSVARAFPDVQFRRSEENRGFAAANNLALHEIMRRDAVDAPRYVALLNPDTLLHNDALSDLVAWLDAHPDVGAVGPQLIQPDGSPQPYSFGSAPSPGYLLRRLWSHVRGGYLHDWSGTDAIDADWVAGTCAVVRLAALRQVGPLDEQFFLYFEDVDWGIRMRAAGWRVVFLPIIKITHIGGGSAGSHTRNYYDRSLVRLYGKHDGGVWATIVFYALRVYRFGQALIKVRQ